MKVSISGDYAFVSAPGEDFGRGSVYVFQRHLGGVSNWGELQRITARPGGQLTLGPGIAGAEPLIQPGTTWNFQTWFRDNVGPCGNGTNTSNGMSVSFLP